jgi:hypothetical protein
MDGRGRSQLEVWRLIFKPRLPVVVVDLHRFDEDLYPDMHQNETIRIRIEAKRRIWIRIRVKTGITLKRIRVKGKTGITFIWIYISENRDHFDADP